MEPSLSLDPNIVLRSTQGESRYGARVVIDPATGDDAPGPGGYPPRAPKRRRSPPCARCRGAGCSTPRPKARISINGVAGRRRAHHHRGRRHHDRRRRSSSSKKHTPHSLALRRFELEGNETLPPGGRQRADAGAARRRPRHRHGRSAQRSTASRGRARRDPRSALATTSAWAMGVLLVGVLGFFTLLEPIALDLKPGDARVSVGRQVLLAIGLERVRVSRASTRCAPSAKATCPPKSRVTVGGRSAGARAASTSSNYPASSWSTPAASRREISADGAPHRRGARHRRRAGRRTHAHLQGAAPSRTRERVDDRGWRREAAAQGRAEAEFRRGQRQLGAGRRHDRSRRQARGRHARESRDGCGHPPRAAFRAGTARLDIERRRDRGRAAGPSARSSSAPPMRASRCARCRRARRSPPAARSAASRR